MLSLASGSVCDVCLEPFGRDLKAPCSISCGHVFCIDCLNHITRPSCPLCRTQFDQRSCIKLHVDVDIVPSPVRATVPTAAEVEARRLQEAIASIANEGTTEARLRQLIAEGRSFLQAQPRGSFSDLRVSHRMIAYLCEIKTQLRSQNQAVDALKAELTAEKADCEKQVQALKEKHEAEREAAAAAETTLRDHVYQAHTAYEIMVQQYNFVVREWMRLNEEVARLHLPGGPHEAQAEFSYTPHPDTFFSPGLDQNKLHGAALKDPNSFLISPLPEFTGRLPTEYFPLPDPEDESPAATPSKPDDQEIVFPRDDYDQSSCKPSDYPVSWQSQASSSPVLLHTVDIEPSTPRNPSFIGNSPRWVDFAAPLPPPGTPSGTARTARRERDVKDMHRSRSKSIPSRPTSRSRPSSRPPTRPVSPAPSHKSLTPTSQGRVLTSSRELHTPTSAHLSIPQGRDGEMRSRLHDLLRDSAASSSLPNMSSSHFPSTFNHENLPSRPPSRTGSSSSHPIPSQSAHSTSTRPKALQHSTSDNYSHLLASSPPLQGPTPLTTPSPGLQRPVATSTASSAALAIEKAQKERQRAEKEQDRERRRAEKDRVKAEKKRAPDDADTEGTNSRGHTNSHSRESMNVYSNHVAPSLKAGSLDRSSSISSGAGTSFGRTYSGGGSSTKDTSNKVSTSQPRYPSAGNKALLNSSFTGASAPHYYLRRLFAT